MCPQKLIRPLSGRFYGCPSLIVLAALLAGCGENIRVYEAPKEPVPVAEAAPSGQERPAVPGLEWEGLPKGWTETGGGEMRAATFAINDAAGGKVAEVAVLPFPGAAGLNDVSIVNMWRDQLGLAKLEEAEIKSQAKQVKVGDVSGSLYDIGGGENHIVSVIAAREGWMWFFKLAGKSDVVESNKPYLVDFLKGLRFTAPAAQPAPPAPATADQGGGTGLPDWKVPSTWTAQRPGMMQLAKFAAAGDGGEAEVSVARLGGMAGGLGPNINRWRGQLGLGSVSDAEAEASARPVPGSTDEAKLVELRGSDKAMAVVMVTQGGATWFYKVTGSPAAVEREMPKLVEFVKSANYK